MEGVEKRYGEGRKNVPRDEEAYDSFTENTIAYKENVVRQENQTLRLNG